MEASRKSPRSSSRSDSAAEAAGAAEEIRSITKEEEEDRVTVTRIRDTDKGKEEEATKATTKAAAIPKAVVIPRQVKADTVVLKAVTVINQEEAEEAVIHHHLKAVAIPKPARAAIKK